MSEEPQANQKSRSIDVAPGGLASDTIDMPALVAAVERLLRRDLELERERLRGGERRDSW